MHAFICAVCGVEAAMSVCLPFNIGAQDCTDKQYAPKDNMNNKKDVTHYMFCVGKRNSPDNKVSRVRVGKSTK